MCKNPVRKCKSATVLVIYIGPACQQQDNLRRTHTTEIEEVSAISITR